MAISTRRRFLERMSKLSVGTTIFIWNRLTRTIYSPGALLTIIVQ